MTGPSNSPWIPLAELLRPQGRRGEILAEPFSTDERLFSTGSTVYLANAGTVTPLENTGKLPIASPLAIEESWYPTGRNAGRIVLKLAGCDSISTAESLAHYQLLIPTADLPTLEADTFFIGDLLGCELYNGDQLAGTVTDVQFATTPDGRTRLDDAAPLLEITPANAARESSEEEPEPILVPFIRAWLDSVDLPNKRITMHLPEGLIPVP